jgi:ADP-ribose pyrophosphatase YjhB (NUDIX family)
MSLAVRYQAAIIQNDHVLLLKVWDHAFSGKTFWVLPGGGRLPNETESDCMKREVRKESHLQVEVERLILDEREPTGLYQRAKTFACRITAGDPRPGSEPEVVTADCATISDVGWFDLCDPTTWDALVLNDPITYPLLQRLRTALGYSAEELAT